MKNVRFSGEQLPVILREASKLRLRLLSVAGVVVLSVGCGGGGGSGSPAGGANGAGNPAPSIPTTPNGVHAVPADGQVTLSWDATTGATSYNVYWSTTSGAARASGSQASATSASYVASGLTDATTYYFAVTAINQAGESAASTEVSAVPLPADTCLATSPTTFVACAADAQAGIHSTILVKGALVCSGAATCAVSIHDMPVTIEGVEGASIRRLDHHDTALIQIVNSPSVAIKDLAIDEDADVACIPVSNTNPPIDNPACGRTIDLFGVAEVSLEDLTIANSKSVAVEIGNSGDTSISHVRFISPYLFGLQVGALTGTFLVADSLFWHSASNAFVISDAHGTAQAPLLVTRTLFEHNHRADVYFVCGPQTNEQCPGGQLLVFGGIDFLNVDHSAVVLGSSDATVTPVGGVEFNPTNVHDVTFTDDDIHSQRMWGVYANPNPTDFARVSFVDDKLYDNGTDPDYLGVDIGNFPAGVMTETGTCHTPTCTTVPVGGLWALPGQPVSWTSNDLTDATVTVNGTAVANTASGQTIAPRGATVVLFDGATEIDRLTVP